MSDSVRALALALAFLSTACGGSANRGSSSPSESVGAEQGARWEGQEGFAVRFPPGFPEPTRAIRPTEDGESVSYTSGLRDGVCIISVGPAPTEGAPTDPLDMMRDAITARGDVVETFVATEVAGRPARAVTFRNRSKSGTLHHSRGVVIDGGSRLFFVAFSSTDPAARSAPEIDAYLASFELVKARS